MPKFNTCYDTTAGRLIPVTRIHTAVKQAFITTNLSSRNFGVEAQGSVNAVFITGNSDEEQHIPPLIHPMLVENIKGQSYMITDVRLYRGQTRNPDNFSEDQKSFEDAVRAKSEYAFVKNRAALSMIWLGENPDRLRAGFQFAGSVFASWISTVISRTYALELSDQAKITALCIYYWHCLHTEDKKLTGERLEATVIHTIKTTKIPADLLYEIFEQVGEIKNVTDFCEELKKVVVNVRMRDFNLAMLYNLVSNTWYGTNAKEILAVSLEHPPTWLALVFFVMSERSFKNSVLFRVIENLSKRGESEGFIRNFATLIGNSVATVEGIDNQMTAEEYFGQYRD